MGIRHRRGRNATRDLEVDYDEHSAVATGAEQEAAGVTAVMVSLRRGLKAMGPFRTAASLLRLNQRKGFDCPGCAWPEEHGGRKFAEFCENGAKAVAEEATKRVVTPDFFARHAMDDLHNRPEYWLSQQGRLTHPMVLRAGAYYPETNAWCRWTTPRPSRIRRCPRRSSFDWTKHGTGDRTAAGQPRHRRRRGDATGDAGRRGAAGDPCQRQAGYRHDAHTGLGCRTGARFSADRGRHRASRRCADRAVLQGSGRRTTSTRTTCWTRRSPPTSPCREVDITRNFYTTSSCGVCGKASLDAVRTISRYSPGDDASTVKADTLSAMPEQLRTEQKVFASTGGLHGAALFDTDGGDAGRARGHRPAQRRRQGHRLGPRAGPDPADRNRAAGQRPRVVRTHPEGGDGRHPGARGGVGAVVARRRSGEPVRRDPGRRSCGASR